MPAGQGLAGPVPRGRDIPRRSLIAGLGSVFGKSLRDSRSARVSGDPPGAGRDVEPDARDDAGLLREPGERGHPRRVHLLALRVLRRADHRPVVDPRALLHTCGRGAPGQPRPGRRHGPIPARDRAPEGGRPHRGDVDPRGDHRDRRVGHRLRVRDDGPRRRPARGRVRVCHRTGDACIGRGGGRVRACLDPGTQRRSRHRRRGDARRLRRVRVPDGRTRLQFDRLPDPLVVGRRPRSAGGPDGLGRDRARRRGRAHPGRDRRRGLRPPGPGRHGRHPHPRAAVSAARHPRTGRSNPRRPPAAGGLVGDRTSPSTAPSWRSRRSRCWTFWPSPAAWPTCSGRSSRGSTSRLPPGSSSWHSRTSGSS